ncbi:MAG: hypothetical protein IPN11_17085 [Opitutaceae bacterium]|jgi:hypothetical protein|nr:hypothetical protein [Opitutaceae bacterium]MCC7017324.1 hypothetical protein [Rhodospirillales bacterium]
MKKSETHAFVNQLLVYTLVVIGFSGSIGLGTVWLRHQISLSANATKQLEARLNEVKRHILEKNAEIEKAQSPAMLEYLNEQMKLGLQPPSPQQVQHIAGDPVQLLAAKRNRGLFPDEPVAVSFQVALKR